MRVGIRRAGDAPNDTPLRPRPHARGFVFAFLNRPGPAIEALQHAMRLSSLDPLGANVKGTLAAAYLVAGRYEEALEWADRSLHEQPHLSPSLRVKVISLAQLDRIEEAQHWLRSLLELQPGLTLAWYRRYLARFVPAETLAVCVEGLRKAGLPDK